MRLKLAFAMSMHAETFLDAKKDWEKEVKFVVHLYGKIFNLDKKIRERGLNELERLQLHQKRSSRILRRLRRWCLKYLYKKRVDPEDGLGKAIIYLLKHWKRLTHFLRVPGIPLDNNTAERALKAKILERKNSYFYRTEIGAKVGDIINSLIQTAIRAKINPFDYLTHLHRNKDEMRKCPEAFLPWNYQRRILHANPI